ncbi:hypothetical protein ACO0RG_002068 [Hanseniaspora osmophila]
MKACALFYPIVALFTLAIFLFNIFNIAGSASGRLSNVYMGEATIRHINVTKILPNVAPIVNVFAQGLTAPNTNTTQIFDSMLALGQSAALKPVLGLMASSEDLPATMDALYTLTPIAASASNNKLSTEMAELIQNTNNQTLLLESLISLSGSNTTATTAALVPVMKLLQNTNNATYTLEILASLSTASEEIPSAELKSILDLLGDSTNITATLGDFQILSTGSSAINTTVEAEIFNAIQTSTNLTQTFAGLTMAATSEEKPFITALADLLTQSSNSTATLIDLSTILTAQQAQQASNSSAALQASAASLKSLSALLASSTNSTLTLQTLPTLLSTSSSDSATQLKNLAGVLENSKNQTLSLQIISDLESSVSASTLSTVIPAFVKLLAASTNVNTTLTDLATVSAITQSNATSLTPLIAIMNAYENSANVSEEYIYQNIMPSMFDKMHLATDFRLGILSLCRYSSEGVKYGCTKAHSVQSFYMKDILYNELETSYFSPYVKALNLTKDDVIIVGDLVKDQKYYVPAVRTLLAFSIISFILAIFIFFGTCASMVKSVPMFDKINAFVSAPCLFISSLISSIILGALCHIIKKGLKHDNYNVSFKYGSAFWGLSWTGFVLAFFVAVFAFAKQIRHPKKAAADEEQFQEESTGESSEDFSVKKEISA